MRTDIDLIKEMGCTAVRLPHYQHAPMFEDLCDQNGLVAWAELGLVNEIDPSIEFAELTKQQLRELIKQNFNHPSICVWGIFNELWFKDRPDQELELVRELNELAHQLDPTRPTTAATDRPIEHPGNWITDLIAFNRYHGWYTGRPEDWPMKLDESRSRSPAGRSIGISEYGAGASIAQHEIDPRKPETTSRWHPEEWQCVVHENAWCAMRDRPELWCKFVWVFADFASANRKEGDMIGMNDKGLVSADRKLKKDAFYFYKANWSAEPFVYICSRRYTPRAESISWVKVYSNCDSVELRLNGRSLGVHQNADRIFRWEDVKLVRGKNVFEAIGQRNGKSFTDACTIVQDSSPAAAPSR